jgi:hypothetical protein
VRGGWIERREAAAPPAPRPSFDAFSSSPLFALLLHSSLLILPTPPLTMVGAPTLQVSKFDFAGEVDLEALATALKRDGGIILTHVANTEDLAQMEKDERSHIIGDKAWTGSFFPAQTRFVERAKQGKYTKVYSGAV